MKTKEIVQKTFDAIVETLVEERRIELRNFGVFEVKKRAARKARNPRTGDKVYVPEKFVVTFKPGKEMEEKVRELERREQAKTMGAPPRWQRRRTVSRLATRRQPLGSDSRRRQNKSVDRQGLDVSERLIVPASNRDKLSGWRLGTSSASWSGKVLRRIAVREQNRPAWITRPRAMPFGASRFIHVQISPGTSLGSGGGVSESWTTMHRAFACVHQDDSGRSSVMRRLVLAAVASLVAVAHSRLLYPGLLRRSQRRAQRAPQYVGRLSRRFSTNGSGSGSSISRRTWRSTGRMAAFCSQRRYDKLRS